MKKTSISALVAMSLAATVPSAASADAKDVLIGGIAGALIANEVHKNKRKKRVTKTYSNATPSLNSQYSRAERVQIQTALANLGYNVGTIDGVLGRNSRRVIRQFQGSRGEPQTGQLTQLQFFALTNPGYQPTPAFVDRPLNPQEVALMQQGLQRLGYYRGVVDGRNGPGTQGARAAFIASQGMNPMTTTQVQSAVMAASATGLYVPPYLQQEAQTQMATMNGANPFQQPQQQQAGFGQQQQFVQPQGQQAGFGQQQQFQQQGTQQAGFGQQQPQQQQLFQQQPQQQQQQLFQQQPQQQGVLASQQPLQQQQQAPASSLDVFTVQPQQQPVQQQGQTQVAQQPQTDAEGNVLLFATDQNGTAANDQGTSLFQTGN